MFSTAECAWHHIKVKVLTRTLVGIRGFDLKKTFEKEYLYAAGNKPIDIQEGQQAYPVTLKLLKFEVDQLNDAARLAGYKDITEVPHEAVVITVSYKKKATDPARSITCPGVAFTEISAAMDTGGKMTEVSMPGLAMDAVFS